MFQSGSPFLLPSHLQFFLTSWLQSLTIWWMVLSLSTLPLFAILLNQLDAITNHLVDGFISFHTTPPCYFSGPVGVWLHLFPHCLTLLFFWTSWMQSLTIWWMVLSLSTLPLLAILLNQLDAITNHLVDGFISFHTAPPCYFLGQLVYGFISFHTAPPCYSSEPVGCNH